MGTAARLIWVTPTLVVGDADLGPDVTVVATLDEAVAELRRRGCDEDTIADRIHFGRTGQALYPL